jgi:hypothetical protein
VAIAATAVIHLVNNIFKLALLGRKANFSVVVKFALPAALMAFTGALLLNYFTMRTIQSMVGRGCWRWLWHSELDLYEQVGPSRSVSFQRA